jgi:hypothetical protein
MFDPGSVDAVASSIYWPPTEGAVPDDLGGRGQHLLAEHSSPETFRVGSAAIIDEASERVPLGATGSRRESNPQ